MEHPPPWWLRFPIYLDWIHLSLVIVTSVTLLAHGFRRADPGPVYALSIAAAVLITVDTLCGLGFRWVILPRVGLAFIALSWCVKTIRWDDFRPTDYPLLALGLQQLWIFGACLAAEIRLRLHSKLRPM